MSPSVRRALGHNEVGYDVGIIATLFSGIATELVTDRGNVIPLYVQSRHSGSQFVEPRISNRGGHSTPWKPREEVHSHAERMHLAYK